MLSGCGKERIERLDVPRDEEILVGSMNERLLVENEHQANTMGSLERQQR